MSDREGSVGFSRVSSLLHKPSPSLKAGLFSGEVSVAACNLIPLITH